jgi:hypothetical protein
MAFQREEYVRACWRRAQIFRLAAAAIAGAGALLFGVISWVERISERIVMNMDPLAAAIAAVALLLVCVILLLSFRLPRESQGS